MGELVQGNLGRSGLFIRRLAVVLKEQVLGLADELCCDALGLLLAHRVTSLPRSNSAAFGAKPTWTLTDQNLWVHALTEHIEEDEVMRLTQKSWWLAALLGGLATTAFGIAPAAPHHRHDGSGFGSAWHWSAAPRWR
jgi:hypothetical protein